MKTLIIAETGCTHEGSLGALLALVDLAAEVGVDVLKTQFVSDPAALCARRNAADYQPYYEWLKFPAEWHEILAGRCGRLGIRYASTVYLPADIAVIDPYVSLYKVAAFEAEADDLLDAYVERMRENDRTLYVSVAMGTAWRPERFPEEIRARCQALRCVSAYPTPPEQLNLATIRAQGFVGLSDHTAPDQVQTGALAVAAGATVIERHIRLESASPRNPDYAVAMSAHALAAYVENIRKAEAAMGEATATAVQPAEEPMAAYRARGRRPKGVEV